MYYILYNPTSSSKNLDGKLNKLYKKLSKNSVSYKINMLEINSMERVFISQCNSDDIVIVCGGDGTLDQFINRISGALIKCRLFYYSLGSGNDFSREYSKYFEITDLINHLPTVKINDKENYFFLNGVGMGIDALVCRSKAQYKFAEVKKSYFSISITAIKNFRPYSVDVEIDGEKRHFENVWFFTCNNGKYMGGGMKVCPKASRNDDLLDVCIVHSISHRKILAVFPFIYIGKHVWFKKYVEIFRCKKFSAIPDGCSLLQRDGEVLDYVRSVDASFNSSQNK